MAIEDRDRYYALNGDKDLDGSEANYETADNIDAVLRDMTDIYANTEAGDLGKAVVLEEVEPEDPEAQPIRRFRLKEVSKPISAQLKEILVGDGNNWAKGNGFTYKIDYIWLDPSTVTTGGPSNFAVAHYVQSMPATFGVMTEVMAPNSQPFNPPRYVWKSGYTTRDDAKQKIAGKAQINIGDDNTDYTSQNRKFWDKNLSGPRIDIGGTAIIEMEGTGDGNSDSDTPVLSMRGRCLIDMCGSASVTPSTDGPYNRRTTMKWFPKALGGSDVYYTDAPDPFWSTRSIAQSTNAFPYIHMHDSSTIVMEGAPILQMRGNSLVNINGQVAIDINGVNGISSGINNRGSNPVAIDIRPGTFIQMGVGSASLPPSTSLFKMTENQIIMCGAIPGTLDLTYPWNQLWTDSTAKGHGYPTGFGSDYFPFRGSALSNNSSPFIFTDSNVMTKWDAATDNNRIGSWKSTGQWSNDPTQYTQGPAVTIQGKTRMVIGDGGTTAMMIGGQGNVSIQMQPQSMSSMEIYAGSVTGADVINIANEGYGYRVFNHAANGNVKYDLTPHGDTYIKFSPITKFYNSICPKETEMMFQWEKFFGFFQGENNYALLDGKQTHIENVGNTFIMRDDTTQEVYETGEGSQYSRFFKAYSGYNNRQEIDVEGTLPSSSEEFAQTQLGQDIIADFNSHKSTLDNNDLIHNPSPLLALSIYSVPEPNYDPTKNRYYNVNYPMQFTLRGQDAEIEFDSTTSWGSDRTSYASAPTTAYTNPDVIQAIKDDLGPDITQYFYKLYNGSMSYKRTTNGSTYHYTIKNPYVELRQTFTSSWASSTVPSAPPSGNTYNSGYYVNQEIDAQYNSTTLPTGWIVYSTTSTTSELRKFTYTTGTVDALNKWKRYAQVQYSVAPEYYETIDYRKPIQTGESGGTKTILQMYNSANLMMRADTINKPYCNEYIQRPCTDVYEYTFTPSETYTAPTNSTYQFTSTTNYGSGTTTSETGINTFIKGGSNGTATDYKDFVEHIKTVEHDGLWGIISIERTNSSSPYVYTITYKKLSQKAAIGTQLNTFINGADYLAFTTYLTTNYPDKELWRIVDIVSGTGGNLIIRFTLKDTSYTEYINTPATDDPVLEMVGRSELRMYGGAYIKGETKYGETTYTFGSTTSDESPVSFTLAELAALKNMLINPPQSFIPLTQAEYDQLDPPDPDTLYVITDGATAQMLPDASVEEF